MNEQHLSEEQLQLLAAGNPDHDPMATAHLAGCDACRRQVDEYIALFAALKETPAPAFAFDVAALVMPQLPVAAPEAVAGRSNNYLIPVLASVFLLIPAVVFRAYFVNLIRATPALFVYPMLIIPVLFILFKCSQMYRAYQRKINALNIY